MSQTNKSDNRHLIWSNINLDFEDWKDDLKAEYPDYDDNQLEVEMCETNACYLEDERVNLDIQLSQPILVIADLGRWNGRFSGYKVIESGNIKDCLYSDTDYSEWYVDKNGDLRCKAIHHDGTNYYLYRVFKDNVSNEQMENLKYKIYEGRATRSDITRLTKRLGDDIARVYGWDIPKQRVSKGQER